MKNLLVIAFAFAFTSTFAKLDDEKNKSANSSIENVADNTLRQFSYSFYKATDVKWVANNNFQKAIFTLEGKQSYALYNYQSQFLVATQKVEVSELPKKAQDYIKSSYAGYTVNSSVKVLARPSDYQYSDDTNSFWISLINQEKQVILLVSPEGESTIVMSKKLDS